MATGKSCYYPRPNYRFLSTDYHHPTAADSALELDESDLFNSGGVASLSDSPEFRRKVSSSGRIGKKASSGKRAIEATRAATAAASSLPVNIPDWSKILRDEYRENRRRESDDDDGYSESGHSSDARVPPHEFLARTRMASPSVHEGVGRTLKGRDLSRVRNAIFEKMGFQD